MPKVFKNFLKSETSKYVFQPAADLVVEPPPREEPPPPAAEALPVFPEQEVLEAVPEPAAASPALEPEEPEGPTEAELELRYAKIQAEAIVKDARAEAEAWKEETRRQFEEELDAVREAARKEGFANGYAEGMRQAQQEGKEKLEARAKEDILEIQRFMEEAGREKARMMDDCRDEIKDMALAIAEKVIRVSLKNSSDIILRMVDAATDTHKKCEWAHIYVADCDLRGKAYTAPELTAALGHISNRVRVIPMADDESGTCIIELPDVILDASVSTQLGAIKEVIDAVGPDRPSGFTLTP